MAQVRFRYGPHELTFDADAAMTMLDVVALRVVSRDLDIDAPALAAKAMTDLHTAGEATIALAYLCAVRVDHGLRWREFLASIPADARPELIPTDPARPDPAVSGLGEALTSTGPPTTA